jgi:hypothetical protein
MAGAACNSAAGPMPGLSFFRLILSALNGYIEIKAVESGHYRAGKGGAYE